MKELEFKPTLKHCIQTLAKLEYQQLSSELMESKEYDDIAADRLQILKEFLETCDFPRIRSEYEPYLNGNREIVFKLWAGPHKMEYRWEIQ